MGVISPVPDPSPGFDVATSVVGRRAVLAVAGELDMDAAEPLRSAVAAALDAGAQELWVDLSATEFMDSTGVHVLLDTRRRLRGLRRRLAVICPDGPVRRVFEITGIADALPLYADRQAAHRDA